MYLTLFRSGKHHELPADNPVRVFDACLFGIRRNEWRSRTGEAQKYRPQRNVRVSLSTFDMSSSG